MKRLVLRGSVLALVLAGLWVGWGELMVELADPPPTYAEEPAGEGPIVVVGDFQPTSFFERTVLGRESNGAAAEKVAAAMAAEEPSLVLLLGDLVFDGSSVGDWHRVDAILAPLRDTGAGFRLAPGNHDWWGWDRTCRRHLEARFEHLRREPWSELRHGGLAFLQIETNRASLGERWSEQVEVFAERLAALDADDEVRGVVVLGHHPPFTNSTVTGDETHVEEAFVGSFLEARKTLLFLAGHAHAYERFEREGKAFVVSGGGGGPRVSLLEGDSARHEDRFEGSSPRPFHYLRLEPSPGGLEVVVRGFETGELALHELERFTLRLGE